MSVWSVGKFETSGKAAAGTARRPLISYRTIAPIGMVVDILAITAACACWGALFAGPGASARSAILGIAPIACALFVSAAKLSGQYHPSAVLSESSPSHTVAVLWFGTVALLGFSFWALGTTALLEPGTAAVFALVGLFWLVAHRACWRVLARKALMSGAASGRRAVLIYQGSFAPDVGAAPDLLRHGIRVDHRLNLGSLDDAEELVRQRIELAVSIAKNSQADEILIAADLRDWERLKPHLALLRQLPLPVSLIARDWLADFVRQPAHILGSSTLVELQHPPLTVLERASKRIMDISISVAGLMLIWPFLALMALLIQLDSPGPVFFRQTRIGFNGKAFKIYKFRTMTVLEDGPDIRQATCEDERVTTFGRWLRRSSIDELPQLFNVIKGDMSLVGPRPHAVSHDNQFSRLIADYAFRRQMKPGITGWAQVTGYRGATPEIDLISSRVQLDMWYIEKWSIWLDIRILLRTPLAVLRGHNAY